MYVFILTRSRYDFLALMCKIVMIVMAIFCDRCLYMYHTMSLEQIDRISLNFVYASDIDKI